MSTRSKVKHRVKTDTKEAPKGASAKSDAKAEVKADAPAPTGRPQKLKVLKKDVKLRGAREAWFNRLVEFDGKMESEFLADTKEKPPALTRNGTAENPSGWVRFFVREGILSLHV